MIERFPEMELTEDSDYFKKIPPSTFDDKNIIEQYGKKLRELRTERGCSLQRVADYIGVDFQATSQVEKGVRKKISRNRLLLLCAFFRCSPEVVLGLEPNTTRVELFFDRQSRDRAFYVMAKARKTERLQHKNEKGSASGQGPMRSLLARFLLFQKIHVDLGAGDQRAGVVGDIDLEKADVTADPDRSADGGERFGLHRRAQIVDRAVQRDVVLAVVDARERARGGVSHRVEKAAVHAAPDVGIFRRDVGGQHAFFLVDRNDADAVVTDKAAVLARKHFLIIFDHGAFASFWRGMLY